MNDVKQAIRASTLLVAVAVLASCSTAPAPRPSCEELVSWGTDGAQITASEIVPAGDAGPAHCKVSGVADGAIRFELLLPEEWNGKFLMGGGGGFVGSVVNQALQLVPGLLERGYATVGTDTGHTGTAIDASWALDDPEAEENFAHRAVHRTAVTAETIIAAFYGEPSAYSYFLGCSRGGGQALIEAQRYPGDFDGIVSMAPAQDWPGIGADFIQNAQAVYPDPGDLSTPVITADNRALLEREILAACDARDDVADGILTDPRDCEFDPAGLPRCPDGVPRAECLTEAQLAAIQTIYRGAIVDGLEVFPGLPYGGENDRGGWDLWVTGGANALGPGNPNLHYAFGTQMYKYLVFDDPEWDYAAYDFTDWREETAAAAVLLNSTDPDLRDFRSSAGKLILAHGWSDPALTALYSIDYYESAEELDPELRGYFRLFLMPGVLHCAGGPGPDRADWITALEAWVENGVAPDELVASKLDADGSTVLTRPLCPYPEVAIYDGTGDPNVARSFNCDVSR